MTEPTTSPPSTPTQLEPERFAELATAIEREVGTFIVGQEQLVRQTLISLLAGSHALLEGVPGLGKTMLVRTMSEALDLGFSRIQFTPGPDAGRHRRHEHHRGGGRRAPVPLPARADLLATSSSPTRSTAPPRRRRAPCSRRCRSTASPSPSSSTRSPSRSSCSRPRTRSRWRARTRCRRRSSIGSSSRSTCRFPSEEDLVRIMERTTGVEQPTVSKAATGAEVVAMQQLARDVPIASHVMAYAIRILRATHPDTERVPEIVRTYVRYGGSPRGAQAIVLGAKISALLDGRFNVSYARRAGRRRPGAAPPGDPELRGRGRGHQHRFDRARDHRRDANRTGRVAWRPARRSRIYACADATDDRHRARTVLRRGLPPPARAARARPRAGSPPGG